MNRKARLYRILSILVLVLVLLGQTSCATAPSVASAGDRVSFADFPQGAEVFFYGDIQRSRSLIYELYRLGSAKILQRVPPKALGYVEEIYGAVYKEGSHQRFFAQVSGRFPVIQTYLSLTFNPDWKNTQAGGRSYWRSKKDSLSLMITSHKVTITDGIPLEDKDVKASPEQGSFENAGPAELQAPLVEDLIGSTFYLVFNSPESLAKAIMDGFGSLGAEFQIPLKQIILKIYPAAVSGSYVMQARFDTASPVYGKALGALLALASRVMQPIPQAIDHAEEPARSDQVFNHIGSLLLSERPTIEGSLVFLTSKPITEAELTLLLHRLLVYFEGTKLI